MPYTLLIFITLSLLAFLGLTLFYKEMSKLEIALIIIAIILCLIGMFLEVKAANQQLDGVRNAQVESKR